MTITGSDVDPAEFDVLFRQGFGKYLAANGVGVWKDTGAFANNDLAIVDGALPLSPSNAIGLASYGVSDDPTLSDSVIGLQVTTRADGQDPRKTSRLTAKVYDQLQNMTHVVLPGGVYVVQCFRQSWASTGQDQNDRWRESSNFYATVHRPSKFRT